MAASVIDGKAAAARIRAEVAAEAGEFAARHGSPPRLCVLIVGDNPASRAYVRTKTRMAAEAGIDGVLIELPATITSEALLARIDALNLDPRTHGILVSAALKFDPHPTRAAPFQFLHLLRHVSRARIHERHY